MQWEYYTWTFRICQGNITHKRNEMSELMKAIFRKAFKDGALVDFEDDGITLTQNIS
jgi:hypothetical protein